MSLAEASAVHPIGDAQYAARIEQGWDIAGNANGGYLMAIAARAASDAAGGRTPVTLTAHFIEPFVNRLNAPAQQTAVGF